MKSKTAQIARFMGLTWGPPGACRPQTGPELAPWTLLLGRLSNFASYTVDYNSDILNNSRILNNFHYWFHIQVYVFMK